MVKLIMSDDEIITGGTVEIRDSTAYVYLDDRNEHEARMEQINCLILYREKSTKEKREAFLTPVMFCTTLGIARAVSTKELGDALLGMMIGVGLGITMLFDKQTEDEVILNLLYEQAREAKKY